MFYLLWQGNRETVNVAVSLETTKVCRDLRAILTVAHKCVTAINLRSRAQQERYFALLLQPQARLHVSF